ncbi:glycoside hydrolase family 27 protein [Aestuariibaculum sediminum]|uniref:Alpha-galactosidase n=1 Tax=Aestuariibaculum sediminum TaxID=2770637 RepID=A0A8J6QLH5_9FLAO|nr:glycoside hydrolase family 27 protein [Aestuariibaculum sediminum]MBD0833439.1 glycoside hydrolase family 27 protein [Aestuariibaculum sediminum]
MKLKHLGAYALLSGFLAVSCKTPQTSKSDSHTNTLHPPLMGWASWNNYRVNINEDIIKGQADALVNQKLNEYGYTYLNIDDGYFGGRDENGKIISHETRFPKGMKHMADYIHAKGLKAGIYSDAGINTCASYWDKDTIGVGMGLYGHDKQDLTLFLKEWDFDFIKVDWCGGEWLGLDEETRYTEIGKLARQLKPSVIYNVCRWQFPGKWVTQIANSWRINGDLADTFESALKTIDANADLWPYSSYGHYNDMDMLQVGRGMTYEEDKTQFSMWCLMHSPLLLGNDLTTLTKETKEIITNEELIALNQSKYVYQARRLVDYGELEVWGKPVNSSISGIVAVALLNRTEETQNIKFDLKSVGIDASKGYETKDLWSKETTPTSNSSEITKSVPAHGVVVLKITGTSIPYNVFQYKDKK